MWFFQSLRGDAVVRKVQMYVAAISQEPSEDDVQWLADSADGDLDRARWELRYARRAIGLLVAERDALDDRTPSAVARELKRALQLDRNIAADRVKVAERQLNERVRAYRSGLEARSLAEAPERRLARVLAGNARSTSAEILNRGAAIAAQYLRESGEALRRAFGAADLPPDQRPSTLRPGNPR